MESLSKQELIATITKQSDQLKRYETRLRDVVTAYKGLAKEKEALEISLKALNKTGVPNESVSDDSVSALTLSLATLSAEKARMEEAFQADKKVTRDKYENTIASMREEMKTLVQQHQVEINNLRAKVSYEIQEREKEMADHAAMMKEFNMKFNAERKIKEKMEDKNAYESEASTAELEKRVRDLNGELEAAQRRLARAEARTSETPQLLVRLQEKMALLEQTHSVAIREEQIKAKRAEEAARKVCARQEERVALLEERLAELSQTVGEYDARKRKDQDTIQHLKESLNAQLLNKFTPSEASHEESKTKSETDNEKLADSEYLQTLIDKIHILKKELLLENEKLGFPIDVPAMLQIDGYENIHVKCKAEIENLRQECESHKKQLKLVDTGVANNDSKLNVLKIEVQKLKDEVENYKGQLESEKQNKAEALKLVEEKLRSEKEYHRDIVSDLKTRNQCLEKQVQTQRDRYAALLEETDNYIRSRSERSRKTSSEESHGIMPDMTSPPHMLHYAHELARKDLDISQLRKDKHLLEGHLRDSQRDATIEKERFKEVIRTLKEEIERLRRSQSREGANLEYLKNVVMAYLMSTNYDGRKHMLNAIAAVLHFTKAEKNLVLTTL